MKVKSKTYFQVPQKQYPVHSIYTITVP